MTDPCGLLEFLVYFWRNVLDSDGGHFVLHNGFIMEPLNHCLEEIVKSMNRALGFHIPLGLPERRRKAPCFSKEFIRAEKTEFMNH